MLSLMDKEADNALGGKTPLRILAADSSDCVGAAIANMLAGDEAEVRMTASGPETLAALASEDFDVVIVCATLADMDFIDLIMEVKRGSKPTPKIIAVSPGGRASSGCAMACALGQGVDGLLYEPFTLEELRATLARALAGNEGE